MLPMELAKVPRSKRARRAATLLAMLGLAEQADQLVSRLSGGQQQRVAIGVALANEPSVLLADEPTGELDTETADDVFAALRTANAETGVTMLVVTHDASVSEQVNRTIAIRDGRISTEVLRTHLDRRARPAGAPLAGVLGARPGWPAAAAAGLHRGA